jgi:hypothetical protein
MSRRCRPGKRTGASFPVGPWIVPSMYVMPLSRVPRERAQNLDEITTVGAGR